MWQCAPPTNDHNLRKPHPTLPPHPPPPTANLTIANPKHAMPPLRKSLELAPPAPPLSSLLLSLTPHRGLHRLASGPVQRPLPLLSARVSPATAFAFAADDLPFGRGGEGLQRRGDNARCPVGDRTTVRLGGLGPLVVHHDGSREGILNCLQREIRHGWRYWKLHNTTNTVIERTIILYSDLKRRLSFSQLLFSTLFIESSKYSKHRHVRPSTLHTCIKSSSISQLSPDQSGNGTLPAQLSTRKAPHATPFPGITPLPAWLPCVFPPLYSYWPPSASPTVSSSVGLAGDSGCFHLLARMLRKFLPQR